MKPQEKTEFEKFTKAYGAARAICYRSRREQWWSWILVILFVLLSISHIYNKPREILTVAQQAEKTEKYREHRCEDLNDTKISNMTPNDLVYYRDNCDLAATR